MANDIQSLTPETKERLKALQSRYKDPKRIPYGPDRTLLNKLAHTQKQITKQLQRDEDLLIDTIKSTRLHELQDLMTLTKKKPTDILNDAFDLYYLYYATQHED